MAYTAEPSDYDNTSPIGTAERNVCDTPDACKYFDSDFANADFSLLWGPGSGNGRNDLGTMRSMGMNFIALYDWAGGFCRDHTPFLNAAWNVGTNPLMVTIPISDYNVQTIDSPVTRTNVLTILYQAYGLDANGYGTPSINPAAAMWRIGNEVELHHLPAKNVATAAKLILDFETSKNILDSQKLVFTSDVDFGTVQGNKPGIGQLLALQKAFDNAGMSDIWHTRMIASINTKNPAPFIDDYVKNVFPQAGDFNQGDGLPLFFSEYGLNSREACEYIRDTPPKQALDCNTLADQNKGQEEYEKAEFQTGVTLATTSPTSKYFYGFAIFQWQDAFWKCPAAYARGAKDACTESLFGVRTIGAKTTDGTINGGPCGLRSASYPVNQLNAKPIFTDLPGIFK